MGKSTEKKECLGHTKYFRGLRYVFVPPLKFLPRSLRPHDPVLASPQQQPQARPREAVCCCDKYSACRAYSFCVIFLHTSAFMCLAHHLHVLSLLPGRQPRAVDLRMGDVELDSAWTLLVPPGQLTSTESSGKEISRL